MLAELLKEADEKTAELQKQAAEEEAAGRITARGFMDELQKLAMRLGAGPNAMSAAKGVASSGVKEHIPMGPAKMRFKPMVVGHSPGFKRKALSSYSSPVKDHYFGQGKA